MRAVTIGTFDGIHRGHKAVVQHLCSIADRERLEPCVITFNRHPLEIIAPQRAPQRLMHYTDEVNHLKRSGIRVEVVDFNDTLRHLTAAEWMRKLRDDYDAALIVMGYDNTFGSDGRHLSADDYRRLAAETGLRLEFAPKIAGISSSRVRRAIADGHLDSAAEMLGRPFSFKGTVVPGDALGRTIGFPTANIKTCPNQLLPPDGVYAVEVTDLDGSISASAVMNLGRRPTVSDNGNRRVEVHIPGWSGDLYGHTIIVTPLRLLRQERRFDSLDALKQQIARDIASLKESPPL